MPSAAEEIEALRAASAAAEARAVLAESQTLEAARDRAVLSGAQALIAALGLEIEKFGRMVYGARSERKARLLDQLELQLEELEAAATEDELVAETAQRLMSATVPARERRRTGRKPFPAHLPRERGVIAAPCRCEACGSGRIGKLGEDGEPLSAIGPRTMASDTLEVVPRQGKVIQAVREKFTCRASELIA